MTDQQIIDIIKKRAVAIGKNHGYASPEVVLMQQYGHKIYLAVKYDNNPHIMPIIFFTSRKAAAFCIIKHDSAEFNDWLHSVICQMTSKHIQSIPYCLHAMPDYIKHIVSGAIIATLKDPNMGIGIATCSGNIRDEDCIFKPNETYEEISVEADMMSFPDFEI